MSTLAVLAFMTLLDQVLKMDLDRCIHVGGKKLTEGPLQAFGLRIQDNFCTELQSHMVLMEVHELLTKYGYSLPDDHTPVYTMSSLREVCDSPRVSSLVAEGSPDGVLPRR
jgi:hypothetical protein